MTVGSREVSKGDSILISFCCLISCDRDKTETARREHSVVHKIPQSYLGFSFNATENRKPSIKQRQINVTRYTKVLHHGATHCTTIKPRGRNLISSVCSRRWTRRYRLSCVVISIYGRVRSKSSRTGM